MKRKNTIAESNLRLTRLALSQRGSDLNFVAREKVNKNRLGKNVSNEAFHRIAKKAGSR
jgi:hypothetical protein